MLGIIYHIKVNKNARKETDANLAFINVFFDQGGVTCL